jgi:hypothetical protein
MLTDFLKNLGLVTLPFSIYFAWTRVGHKVAASYSWHVGKFTASGIGSVTLINMKDRPLTIFEIHAVMGDVFLQIREFSPPLIIKAMKAMRIDTGPASNRRLGPEIYEWNLLHGRKAGIDIYLSNAS